MEPLTESQLNRLLGKMLWKTDVVPSIVHRDKHLYALIVQGIEEGFLF